MNSKLIKSLVVAAALATGVAAPISYTHAQDSKTDSKATSGTPFVDGGVIMREDKMWIMRRGRAEPLDRDVTMSNGYRVAPDGTVYLKDGTRRRFRNGERMDPGGNISQGEG